MTDEIKYARVSVPSQFLHPYERTDKDGRTWQMGIFSVLPGTKINGVDFSGYSLDLFLHPFNIQDKALGKNTTISFDPDKTLTFFKGKGESRRELYAKPWDFCRATKAARMEFAERVAAERAPEIEADRGHVRPGGEERDDSPVKSLDALESECSASERAGRSGEAERTEPR